MSRLWIILGGIFTVSVISFATFGVVNVLAHEEVTRRDRAPLADVERLQIDAHHGTIEVIGDDAVSEIAVDTTVSHGLRRTRYDVTVEDGTLTVDSDCPLIPPIWCRVDVRVVVPTETAVDVENRDGRVTIRDIAADVTVGSSNGTIELRRLSGRVTVRTSNGPIRGHGLQGDSVRARTSNGPVELAFTEPPTAVEARTSNGPIHIVVPDDDTAYAIDTRTGSFGSTDTPVRTDPTSDHTIVAHTSNGPVTVYYPTS